VQSRFSRLEPVGTHFCVNDLREHLQRATSLGLCGNGEQSRASNEENGYPPDARH